MLKLACAPGQVISIYQGTQGQCISPPNCGPTELIDGYGNCVHNHCLDPGVHCEEGMGAIGKYALLGILVFLVIANR